MNSLGMEEDGAEAGMFLEDTLSCHGDGEGMKYRSFDGSRDADIKEPRFKIDVFKASI